MCKRVVLAKIVVLSLCTYIPLCHSKPVLNTSDLELNRTFLWILKDLYRSSDSLFIKNSQLTITQVYKNDNICLLQTRITLSDNCLK